MRGKRFSGLFVLLGLAVLLVNLKPAFALVTVTPNPAVANQPITFSDIGGGHGPIVSIYSGSGCTGNALDTFTVNEDVSYSVTLSAGLPAGSYSVNDDSGCVPFTVNPAAVGGRVLVDPLQEYAFGLTILAIFMIIGYGFVRRRTRNDHV